MTRTTACAAARRRPGRDGAAILTLAAERTGGQQHEQARFFRASSIARAFKSIFEDFRQSYVLHYSPSGVKGAGWHAIAVTVPAAKNAAIRARQGYYGGTLTKTFQSHWIPRTNTEDGRPLLWGVFA